MTGLLQKAFERVAALPQEEQDRLACILLAELESEQRLSEHIGRPESEAPRDRLAESDINHLKQKTLTGSIWSFLRWRASPVQIRGAEGSARSKVMEI